MKQTFLSILLMLLPMLASADPVEIDGIFYNLVKKVKTAEVTANPDNIYYYSGAIDIPSTVTYEGIEYDVTSIGASAFYFCPAFNSITIPNSVTSIGSGAFAYSGLNSITIGNNVKSIGESAFNTSNLAFVHITDIEAWCNIKFSGYDSNPLSRTHKLYLNGTELTELVIPASVSNIGDYAFCNCSGLTSITIPNSVTSIGNSAFLGCSGLTSLTIPNSVTSIEGSAFSGCSGLTSIKVESDNVNYDSRNNCNAIIESSSNYLIVGCQNTVIPNSVTSIGEGAFIGCSGLNSVNIPNSVTSIGYYAFQGCTGLTSVTIPLSVTDIGDRAFANCDNLMDVYCMAEVLSKDYKLDHEGLYTVQSAFIGSYPEAMSLYVPVASIEAYNNTAPWSSFKTIVAIGGGEIPETPKCATPTITYKNGKINFSCETEGVEYVSTISAGDTKSYFAGEITLTNKYTVSVYATKDGYDKSDTATLDIIGSVGTFGDLNEDGEVNVADHVELSKIILNKSK